MIKKFTLLAFLTSFFAAAAFAQGPCTTTNATGCVCETPGQTNCELLPDITISDYGLLNHSGGPSEFSQTGNGVDNGRLRISASTPNIGFGPFTVGAVNTWVCNGDTFNNYAQATQFCPNPQQLIKQKIYRKDGNNMTYRERWAGGMTYHPSHGHMHVDDWGVFTLRAEDPNEPNPLNWPIVGDGAKIGFCLMDYGTCSNYNGHCRDANNNIMLNGDFANYALGGGQYNCSSVEQGISVGYTDIYSEYLDGMWIDIPANTCNGNYFIVIEVDPHNVFEESNETNNWLAVPFTLTKQVPNGQFQAGIAASSSTKLCAGDAVTLSATFGTSYLWSNGDTTQNIQVTQSGTYTCTVSAQCGTDQSGPITVTVSPALQAPVGNGDNVCEGSSATLTVTGTGDYRWYDALTAGNQVGSGPSFTTPSLFTTTDYYVAKLAITPGTLYNFGPLNGSFGSGADHTNNSRYLEFNADEAFTLQSVWVNAGTAGNRTIELRDANNSVIQTVQTFIPAGASRVTLNMAVPQGQNLRLGLNTSSMASLYRNDSGVIYPYSVSNVAEITGSSAGAQYYYFWYDWEIRTADMECASPRTAVTALVAPAPVLTVSGLAPSYSVTNSTPVPLTGTPSGGTFSGPGISGNNFVAALAGVGIHTISYTYMNSAGCSATQTETVTVNNVVALQPGLFAAYPQIFPNPNQGRFTLRFSLSDTRQAEVRLLSLTGQSVLEQDLGTLAGQFAREFDISSLAKGVYFLELTVDGQAFRSKMVYQ